MSTNFKEMFGSAWSWRDLLFQNLKKTMFVTDDFENIEITGFESSVGTDFEFVFTYTYKGITYKTNDLKPIDMNTEKNEIVYEEEQRVKVTFKNDTGYEGIIKKVSIRSLQVVTDEGDNKLVVLSAATIEILSQPKLQTKTAEVKKEEVVTVEPTVEKKATEQPKKSIEKTLPYMAFVLNLSGIVTFPEKELEKANLIKLTPAGMSDLLKLERNHKAGKYIDDVESLVIELGRIGKDLAKVKKEGEKPTPKAETKEAVLKIAPKDDKPEPVIKEEENKFDIKKAISLVKNDKDFANIEVLILTEGFAFVSKKKGFEVKLTEFKNGNIYVEDVASKKVYYTIPSRFAIHFDVK